MVVLDLACPCIVCMHADGEQTQQVVAQTQHLEAKAQGHAQAQSQLVVHAHNLTAKAHAHATAQVGRSNFGCGP